MPYLWQWYTMQLRTEHLSVVRELTQNWPFCSPTLASLEGRQFLSLMGEKKRQRTVSLRNFYHPVPASNELNMKTLNIMHNTLSSVSTPNNIVWKELPCVH